MKSNTKKRLIAFMLCMVLVLSSATSVFADEPQNTDSQSQTEAVTEPAADEATGDTTTEDTTTEDVSTENTITEDVSDTPDIEIPSKKEWSVQVGNATVKVNGSADALPADAQLSVTEITSEDEVKEIEKAVEEKAIEEQFSIKNIFSYDIKFLVNGSEVQPTTPVQVSVDTPEITSSENAAVLHVDDNNVAEDMKGAVDGEGKVVFDAPHFSKYVIVQKGNSKVNVTIEYYDDTQDPKTMIYASKKELSPGERINNYDIADNWNINWAEKSTTDGNFERISNLDAIQVVSDCTIKVYYTPQDKTITGSTTFYDYTVKAGKQNEIYYSFNQLKNDKSPDIVNNQKLIAGTNDSNVGQNYPEYQKYKISLKDSNNDTKDANCYTGGDSTIPGLLKEIDDNGNVIFNYAEPGFFVDSDYSVQFGGGETRNLRKVYKDYTLEFARKGDTYTLNGVRNKNNGWVTGAGNNFYPLNSVKPSYEESEKSNNYYFGMRYDVTFKIGDYVGPLNYKFTGDDDLWVVLDGKKIVIDLGGIHSAAEKTVDLWQYIGQAANLTEAQKQQNHTSLANGTIAATDKWTLADGKSVAKSSEVKIEKTVSQPDVAVGDKVDYTINGTIPSYGAQFENPVYKITDTITNAKYASDITVTIGGKPATVGTDYTITGGTENDNNFEITFLNVGNYYNMTDTERAVVITYKAEILATATSTNPAINTAKLTYSNKPGETKDATEKKTYTYTFELDDQFTKVDENGNPLDGCTFTLTNNETNKVYTCTTEIIDGKAKIHFEGLDAGEYTLVETVAKEGYSINNTKYTVKITPEYNTDGTLKSKTITIDGNKAKVEVQNTKISVLPSTGGIGTTIFTIAGCVIMIAAAGLFFASRKKSDNK